MEVILFGRTVSQINKWESTALLTPELAEEKRLD